MPQERERKRVMHINNRVPVKAIFQNALRHQDSSFENFEHSRRIEDPRSSKIETIFNWGAIMSPPHRRNMESEKKKERTAMIMRLRTE